MRGFFANAVLLAIALIAVTNADAQTRHRRAPREVEHAAPPPVPFDKRDSVVTAPGAFNGKPYWLVLAQCGGIYFKLNTLYADAAAHARAVKPDPKAATEYTKDLNDAIQSATVYFDATEHFLMTDRGLERNDAVLTYDAQSSAAGDRDKTIDEALADAKACPALYRTCQEVYPKACDESLTATD